MAPRVLVVDDEVEVAKSIQRLLRTKKLEVAIAGDGPSALTLLDEFGPDLVITDFRMPVMTGAELVLEIQRRRPQTICLVLSGYIGTFEVTCECLKKPFDSKALVATIMSRLDSRSQDAR